MSFILVANGKLCQSVMELQVHDRFQEWRKSGLFERMWQAGLLEYDDEKGLEWEWQAIDGSMTKAPLGGAGTGPNPTDRGKKGTKRSF